jgi:mannosylglycoprotein endo-beta-mannosidase
MGKQTLHKVDIIIDVEGFGESDSWTHLLGIREIKSHVDQATGGRYNALNIIFKVSQETSR